jgi:hypothetical protein
LNIDRAVARIERKLDDTPLLVGQFGRESKILRLPAQPLDAALKRVDHVDHLAFPVERSMGGDFNACADDFIFRFTAS